MCHNLVFIVFYLFTRLTFVHFTFPFAFFYREDAFPAVEKLYEQGLSDYMVCSASYGQFSVFLKSELISNPYPKFLTQPWKINYVHEWDTCRFKAKYICVSSFRNMKLKEKKKLFLHIKVQFIEEIWEKVVIIMSCIMFNLYNWIDVSFNSFCSEPWT